MPGGRKLRSTRKGSKDKDYAKIHEGLPLPDDDEQMSSLTLATSAKLNKKQKKVAAKKHHQQQQQQQKKEKSTPSSPSISPIKDGDDSPDTSDVGENSDDSARSLNNINKPKTKTGNRYVCVSDDGDSDDEDIVMKKAEEKLKKLRKKEERVKREEKLRRIQEETEQLEKSLKKKKRSKHQTTTADLRSMSAVVAKVDTLMDEKKLNFRDTSDSDSDRRPSNNSSGNEHGISDSGSGSEEEQQIIRRKEINEEKGRGKKSDLKSGKEVKLTSNIRYPQKWPHSFLKLHYVAKEKKYDDLTLAEFCAGYTAILKFVSHPISKLVLTISKNLCIMQLLSPGNRF